MLLHPLYVFHYTQEVNRVEFTGNKVYCKIYVR